MARVTKKELDEIKAAYLAYMSHMIEDEDGHIIGLPSLYSFAAEVGIDGDVEQKIAADAAIIERAKKLRSLALISAMLTKRVDSTAAWHIIDKSGYILTEEFFLASERSEGSEEGSDGLSDFDRQLIENLAARLDCTEYEHDSYSN